MSCGAKFSQGQNQRHWRAIYSMKRRNKGIFNLIRKLSTHRSWSTSLFTINHTLAGITCLTETDHPHSSLLSSLHIVHRLPMVGQTCLTEACLTDQAIYVGWTNLSHRNWSPTSWLVIIISPLFVLVFITFPLHIKNIRTKYKMQAWHQIFRIKAGTYDICRGHWLSRVFQ